jgi:hypothetical protein
MILFIVILLWLSQSIISFILLCKAWLFSWDVELDDAVLFGILSLIPVCIAGAIFIYLLEWDDHRQKSKIVIFKRKETK